MKILFATLIPLEFNTSATIQNKGIIKGLAQLGHQVDILTLKRDTELLSFDESMNDIKNFIHTTFEIPKNQNYTRMAAKKNSEDSIKIKLKNLIKKIYKFFYVFEGLSVNIKNLDKVDIDFKVYDLLITASDPKASHLLGKQIKNKSKKLKWIQYWGDPMVIDITSNDGILRKLIKKHSEESLIKSADRIVYATPFTLAEQKKIYKKYANKLFYAHQSNMGELEDSKANNKVGYYGAYYSHVRNFQPLYNAMKKMKENFEVCGSNDYFFENTDNIYFYKHLSYDQIKTKESECKIIICLCNKFGTQIPGKIYYVSSYNKPIVVIVDGNEEDKLVDYLSFFNRYIICKNNEEDIIRAIERADGLISNDVNYGHIEKLSPTFFAARVIGEC